MKKILLFLLVTVGASVVLSSCSQMSTITVAKRHFKNGYYIDYGSNLKKTDVIQSDAPAKDQPVLASTQKPAVYKASIKAAFPRKELVNRESLPNRDNAIATSELKQNNRATKNRSATLASNVAAVAKTLVEHPKEIKNSIAEKKITARHSNGNLIWTIIAILVILILLDILTGGWLGGLLYLLLVIVLILLLLRLLGIV